MSRTLRRCALILTLLAGAVLAVLAIAGIRYTPNIDIPTGFAGQHVEVNGIPLRVVQQGTGRDLLLIHGSPGSIEDFSAMAPTLSQSFRVTIFDRPGHGFSGDSGQYSVQYNAQVALDLIHRLDLQHVIVVGHSYGGATALAMALRDDPAVDAYVIMDSATYTTARQADAALQLIATPIIGTGLATVLGQQLAPSRIRQGLLAIFHTPPGEEFIALRTQLWSTPKVTHAVAMETVNYAAALAALTPQYPRITRPVYIAADASLEIRRTNAERLHQDIRGSALMLLADTGHYVQFEKAAEVIDMVRRAAADNPPPERSITTQAADQP